jgi:hypothetical protein
MTVKGAAPQAHLRRTHPPFPQRQNEHGTGIEAAADLAVSRGRIVFPHAGARRAVEPLHRDLHQGRTAQKAGVEHAGRHPSPALNNRTPTCHTQTMASASWPTFAAKRPSGGTALLDASWDLV